MSEVEAKCVDELLTNAQEILGSGSPALGAYKDLILEVLGTMLSCTSERPFIDVVLSPEVMSALERKLYDRIATVISKTYLEIGDKAELPDDRALEIIRDLLINYDEFIIHKNKYKPLRRWAGLKRTGRSRPRS